MDHKALLLKHFDVKGYVAELLSLVVKPKLDEMVASSTNKIDDVIEPMLYPMVEKAVLEAIAKI